MCGIFGYISDKPLNDELIIKSLIRRGPDNSGEISFSSYNSGFEKIITLIHTRLSIIDTDNRSNQPFTTDQRYFITYNGEIYNYKIIKDELISKGVSFKTTSDTEVVLKAYIYWGKKALNKLRGMFAFAIFDKEDGSLFLARDPFGMKPLYYSKNNGNFVFSSLLTSIMESGFKDRYNLNKYAINDYMSTGSFVYPDTILEDVFMLSPGHFIEFNESGINIEKYIDFSDFIQILDKPKTFIESVESVRKVVLDSVSHHLFADVDVGILLSGGIDSSVIAGVASKLLKYKINTYSIGYIDKAYNTIDETKIAEKTSKFLKSKHENILIDYSDFNNLFSEFIEGIDTPSIDGFNTYIISKNISKKVKVVLSGLGGDEMFAGYSIFKDMYNLSKKHYLDSVLATLPNKVNSFIGKNYLKYYNQSANDVLLSRRLLNEVQQFTKDKILDKLNWNSSVLNTTSLFEIRHYMANTLLRDSDAVSMYNGLEIRTPFVDKEVLKMILTVPDRYKIDKKVNKPLLVHAFKDVLIDEVYNLPKRGFSLPIPEWVVGIMKDKRFETEIDLLKNYSIDCPLVSDLVKEKSSYNSFKWLMLYSWLGTHLDKIEFSN